MNTKTASTHLRGLITAAILGALAAGFAGVSTAGDGSEMRSETVNYSDLNLSSPQGAAALYRRITRAAHNVCDWGEDSLDLRANASDCVDKAIADAVTRVGHPQLIAVYNARHRRPLPVALAAIQPQ